MAKLKQQLLKELSEGGLDPKRYDSLVEALIAAKPLENTLRPSVRGKIRGTLLQKKPRPLIFPKILMGSALTAAAALLVFITLFFFQFGEAQPSLSKAKTAPAQETVTKNEASDKQALKPLADKDKMLEVKPAEKLTAAKENKVLGDVSSNEKTLALLPKTQEAEVLTQKNLDKLETFTDKKSSTDVKSKDFMTDDSQQNKATDSAMMEEKYDAKPASVSDALAPGYAFSLNNQSFRSQKSAAAATETSKPDSTAITGNSALPSKEKFDYSATRGTDLRDEYSDNSFFSNRVQNTIRLNLDGRVDSYNLVKRNLYRSHLPKAEQVNLQQIVNAMNYPVEPQSDELKLVSYLTDCPWDKTHKLLFLNLASRPADSLPGRNFTLVLDLSKSSSRDLFVAALPAFLDRLSVNDRVSVISANKTLLSGSADKALIQKTAENAPLSPQIPITLPTSSLKLVVSDRDEGLVQDAQWYLDLSPNGASSLQQHYSWAANPSDAVRELSLIAQSDPSPAAENLSWELSFSFANITAWAQLGLGSHSTDSAQQADGILYAGRSLTALFEIVPASATLSASDIQVRVTGNIKGKAFSLDQQPQIEAFSQSPDSAKLAAAAAWWSLTLTGKNADLAAAQNLTREINLESARELDNLMEIQKSITR